ncbi:hypothetical protein K466DRAFT_574462 [Polyporus arcularius HHB13444]|uniref:Uncharacterized protein n=1 Tax=Polyporus arcularius HHB13444 TaxID=1314778 RepID=A0A5C3PM70_9APHY|nr:hypothetical protein K466DRAFT_574462 [Polyporus arcularius HHB13444]
MDTLHVVYDDVVVNANLIRTRLSGIRSPREDVRVRPISPSVRPLNTTSFLPVVDDALKRVIIEDWQNTVTTENLRLLPCAVCARRTPAHNIHLIHPSDLDLSLLRNDTLPQAVIPTTYAYELYDYALLYPKAMTDPWTRAPMNLVTNASMPRLSLANWLYYGLDELPLAVSTALTASTPIDRLLVSRARASRISFRFKESLPKQYPPQRYVRGNILVMPHNSTTVHTMLPPSPSAIRDTLCAVFVGRTMPTMESIRKLYPLLARKSTIETLIRFLVENNPYYAVDQERFFGLSTANLDALFGPGTQTQDVGVPCSIEIGFLENSEAIRATTTGYANRNQDDDLAPNDGTILMENVGYTSGDESPVAYRQMKMSALSHCLHGGQFICSKAGDRFVPDFENPALLTWLFPHLDPWGIGCFHHPDRSRPISMEEQLRYLLEIDDSPFERDPDFAFVYYNILQKKNVCDSVRFRVKASQQRRIVANLLSIDKILLEGLIKQYQNNASYEPRTAEERSLLSLIDDVSTVLHNIPGTTGYKLNLRNEIRALVNYHGTPAFFVTLNPSDVHHPLVRLFAGEDIVLEDAAAGEELTAWQRGLLVARHPGACARFFHTIISSFIDIVLRHGKPRNGIFGKCSAYYGTVEAQARGDAGSHARV